MNDIDLHGYQWTTVFHILRHTHCGVFLDMGLGKTVSTLTAFRILKEEKKVRAALVIAPKRVAESVWPVEINKWDHLKGITLSKITGPKNERKRALMQSADIYVLGRDNVKWLYEELEGKPLPFDMLIIDESSSFKNPRAIRFKALRKIRGQFSRIVELTGTPAPNGLVDLWAPMFLLDGGERLGKFITHFRDEYFTPGKRNGPIVYTYNLKRGSEERIHNKIKDICISMKAQDYIKMPDVIINDVYVDFPPRIQKMYDQFEEELVLELVQDRDKPITATNSAVLSNKLLQFANGAIYDEDHSYHEIHDLKLEALEEIIEDANGKPVLIAWGFIHDMERIRQKLKKYDPRELKDDKDIQDWNAGKIKVLMMHPASGGHGLNLQYGGHIVVWFGHTWSLEFYNQLNARLNRQGQKNRFVLNRIIARKTEDQNVIKAIRRKDMKQETLMEATKARIEKYVQNHPQ